MQVTEDKAEGLRREFKVAVPAAEIEESVTSRLKELARTVNYPGFRPGKVPVNLLRKKYGTSVMGEVLEKTVNQASSGVLSERGLRAATDPKIEITAFEDGADLEFTMAVELMPEIGPIDYSKIELERLEVDVEEADVVKTLEHLANVHKTSEPVTTKRKAKDGDVVVIDFTGRVDGEEFVGGKAEAYHLELGSGSLIPGFEEQLVGAKAGDHLDVKVTFPEGYVTSDLANREAVFKVDVKELRQTAPFPIDDELAIKVGMENLEELRKGIREERQREYGTFSRQRLKRALLDILAADHDFEVPPSLAEKEFDGIWKHFEEQRKVNPQGVDPEDAGKSDDELKDEFRAIAERRVRLGMLLSEIGRLNNVQVGREEINRAIAQDVRRYPGREQETLDYYRKSSAARELLSAPLYEEKVVDFILEMATVTDRKVTLEELFADPAPATVVKAKPKPKPKKKPATRKKTATKD